MMDIMFEIPSDERITKVVITEDTIKKGGKPEVHRLPEGEVRPMLVDKSSKNKEGMETA